MKDVKEFFGMSTRQFADEWKQLNDEERLQLKTGIGNGSLTY